MNISTEEKLRARTEGFVDPFILALFCLYTGLGLAHICV
jgi:hypothetical protein